MNTNNVVNYSESYTRASNYIKNYNKCLKLSEQIRPNISNTLKTLINIYGYQINQYYWYSNCNITDETQLPSLRVNNHTLSLKTGNSKRTIQNHLDRLEKAQIITKKWRGTKNDYFINFTQDIVFFKFPNTQNLPHKQKEFETLIIKNNSNSNKNVFMIDTSKVDDVIKNNNLLETPKTEVKNIRKEQLSAKIFGTKNEISEQKTYIEPIKSEIKAEDLIFYISLLWNYMCSKLYYNTTLTDDQIIKGKDLLISYYSNIYTQNELSKIHNLYILAVDKANDYMKRTYGNSYTFTIPTVYLDKDNLKGKNHFTTSIEWAKNTIKFRKIRRNKDLVDIEFKKVLSFYICNHFKSNKLKQFDEITAKIMCIKRLRKFGDKELIQKFENMILTPENYKNINKNAIN